MIGILKSFKPVTERFDPAKTDLSITQMTSCFQLLT